ncbi:MULTISPECIES: tryptophan--tRNA ligase [unclassified Clostridioides]|uniref:tryptophan--tRNA ligase n=1 Tax=unclassified Clostridioides TaxID=2635829 RepID=UPI001D11275B|nr:tryptophan--tRNA ligase [Clostridioides sp. ZZV15-6388]MCC0664787.1 tryptophan--tRNA ligase [Clostridioides sp. ZZV15-6597]MCC0717284.1 tryptophan--tRNA ligase [Clostridioides sp. ZZV14-6105]MCC0721169.1 tryptophan--tRNA ligase [Clostridioides sp. ZZV14-6104]MCC0726864.1 tryptophan--tRNA ligase [Clostridioides sp. ZZV14-6045]MCC0730243.1 tryptophan--tRNA ligase [Clostridioides sp. ZZV14-6048]MCC0733121.1 tryptophan--tRNA ligase [Clostridioides sp. ZZV14-6009]MCC0737345.1 tryptophan--tRNA 
MSEKKVIFSGAQPSGKMTLGNYLGAIKNWTELQENYNCYYSIVDLHAITVPQDPKVLRANTIELLAQYLACGLDPEKNTIFIQSHVKEHVELMWILNTMTYMGELSRMTQFKDKSQKSEANLNAGLFTYPVLMAADILLYQADLVPVGDDQKQHLELSRDLANRFNNRFSPTFVVPEGYYPKGGARVMSLQEPTKKMSKSDSNENAFILLADDSDTIKRKIKRSVTDSLGVVKYTDEQPGIKNLLDIYSNLSKKSVEEIVNMYEGKGYGVFKEDVAEVVSEALRPIREKYVDLLNNKDYLEKIYTMGAEKAEKQARKTLRKVYKKVGFIERRY